MAIEEKQILDDQAVIFREDQPADRVYLVVHGEVQFQKITPSGVKPLHVAKVGEFIGINSMLDNQKYSVTAKAKGVAHVVGISKTQIEGQLMKLDKLTLNMIKSVIERHNQILQEK